MVVPGVWRCGMTAARADVAGWAWDRQSVWSQTANQLKAGPQRIRRVALILTVCVGALALAASQLEPVNHGLALALGVAAAVVAALVTVVQARNGIEQVRAWTRARSVSEAIKAEVFLYVTRVGRYGGEDREQRLDAEVQRLEHEVDDLAPAAAGVQPAVRSLPDVHDLETYLDVRVKDSQIEKYYAPNARRLARRLRLARNCRAGLTIAAAGLAALATVSSNVAAWAAVVTAAAAAVSAHVAAERYEYLLVEYSRTASELRRLVSRRTAADGSPLSGPDLIQHCEEVISIQNQAWMAKLGTPDERPSA